MTAVLAPEEKRSNAQSSQSHEQGLLEGIFVASAAVRFLHPTSVGERVEARGGQGAQG